MASSGANTPAGPSTAPSSGTTTPASVIGDGQPTLTKNQRKNQRTKFRRKRAKEAKRAALNASADEASDDSSDYDEDAGDATPAPAPKTPTAQQNVPSPLPTPTPRSKRAEDRASAKEQNAGKSAPSPAPKTPTAQPSLPSLPPPPTPKRGQGKEVTKEQNAGEAAAGPSKTPTARQNQPSLPSPTPKSAIVQGKAAVKEQHTGKESVQTNPVKIYPATPKVAAGPTAKTPMTPQNIPSASATQPKSKAAQEKGPAKEEQSQGPSEPAEQTGPKTTKPATPKEPTNTPTAQLNVSSPSPIEPKSATAEGTTPAQEQVNENPSQTAEQAILEKKISRRAKKRMNEQLRDAQNGLKKNGAGYQAQSTIVAADQVRSTNVADHQARSTNVTDNQPQSTNVAVDQASDATEELGRGPLNKDPDISVTITDTEAGDPPTQYLEQPLTTTFKWLCDIPFRAMRGVRRIFQYLLNAFISMLILIGLAKESPIDEQQKALEYDKEPRPNTSTKRWFWQRRAPANAATQDSEKEGGGSGPTDRDAGELARNASSWYSFFSRTAQPDAANGNPEEDAAAGQALEADESERNDGRDAGTPVGKPTAITRAFYRCLRRSARGDPAGADQGSDSDAHQLPDNAPPAEDDGIAPTGRDAAGEPTSNPRGWWSWFWRRTAQEDPTAANQGPENAAPPPPAQNADPPLLEQDELSRAYIKALEDMVESFAHMLCRIFTYMVKCLAVLWRRNGVTALVILVLSSVYIPLCSFMDLPCPTSSSYVTDFYDDPSHDDDLVSSIAKIQDVTTSTATTRFMPNEAFLKAQNLQIPALRGDSYATEHENFVSHFIHVKVAVDEALSEFDRRSAAAGVDLLHLARPEIESSKKRGTQHFLQNLSHLIKQQAEDVQHIWVSLRKIPPLLTDGDTLRQFDDVYSRREWFQWPFSDLHTRHAFRDNLNSLSRYYIRQTDRMERANVTLTALREELAKQRGWGLIDLGIEAKAWRDVAEMIEEMLRILEEVGAWNRRFSHGN
ncbi:MAG: hypothetical protein Q9194_006029 [Teloschistes cf. exilis]